MYAPLKCLSIRWEGEMSGRETATRLEHVCVYCLSSQTLCMSVCHIATLWFFQIGPLGVGICIFVFFSNVKTLGGQTSSKNISIFSDTSLCMFYRWKTDILHFYPAHLPSVMLSNMNSSSLISFAMFGTTTVRLHYRS